MNTRVIIDSSGNITATYSKIHLFNVDIKGGVRLKETDFTILGKRIARPVDTPVGKVGLSIVSFTCSIFLCALTLKVPHF